MQRHAPPSKQGRRLKLYLAQQVRSDPPTILCHVNDTRLVHFSYGLLLAYPIREVFLRVADVRGFWGYFLPLDVTMSTSMIFELFEWTAAMVFGEGQSSSVRRTEMLR